MGRKRHPLHDADSAPETEPEVSEEEGAADPAPPAAVPEKAEAAPAPAPAPVPELPRVGLDVFAQVSGLKPDQLAGFVRWAKRSKLVARTIPEWKSAMSDFDNRPV